MDHPNAALQPLTDDLAAAVAEAGEGGPAYGTDLLRRLRSGDSREALRALHETIAQNPPALDLLRAAIDDETLGSYRALALDAAARAAAGEPWVKEALLAAVSSDDPMLRDVARRRLPPQDLVLANAGGRGVPSAALSAALGLGSNELSDPGVVRALWRLADDHPDADVRDRARYALSRTEPGDARRLRIAGATYGIDERRVDVRDALARRIVRDRLRVRAGNDLAGDPAVGVVKEMVVVYEYGGRTWRRTVREGSDLLLP